MFDLEKAIAAWRRSFKRHKTFIGDDLDELEQHLRDHIEDVVSAGESEKEAFYLAAHRLGNHSHIEAAYHQAYWTKHRARRTYRQALFKEMTMFGEYIRQDTAYALRTLFKKPVFTLLVILTLALGIGANTAIFSVVNGVLLKSLPYEEPDRIVRIWGSKPSGGMGQFSVAPGNFSVWRAQNTSFTHMTAFDQVNATLTGAGEAPARLSGVTATADFMDVMGAKPLMGRFFSLDEDRPGGERVAVISYGLWQGRFGGATDILGRSINVNGNLHTVIGIMPPEFTYPQKTEIWMPIVLTEAQLEQRGGHYLQAIGRLKPEVTADQALRDLQTIAGRLEAEYPDTNTGWTVTMKPLAETIIGDIRPALLMLLGAVTCVLLIACANVANLLMARASTRRKEIAIRTAVGAQRRRIIRQLLTEYVLLALLGGGFGILIAYWGLDVLRSLSPGDIPRLDEIRLDARVLAFTAVLSLAAGLLAGLMPALHAADPNQTEALKEGGRTSQTEGRNRFRHLLIGAEVALSLMVLIVAGLLLKSFDRLQNVDPGFNPEQVLTAWVVLPRVKYGDAESQITFIRKAMENIQTLPGVSYAGLASPLPLTWDTVFGIMKEGDEAPQPGRMPSANHHAVSADYFQAMGIPLLKGRAFTDRDIQAAPRVVVINETMAQRFYPDEDPVGKRLHITNGPLAWREIIGVTGDVRHYGLDRPAPAQVYEPVDQVPTRFISFVIQTSGDPAALNGPLRDAIQRIDPDLPVTPRPMMQMLSESIAQQRFSMLLLCLFAGIALMMSALGIYGIVAYAVQQRTQEIGVRMAMGAGKKQVLTLVIRQGMLPVAAGLVLGLVGAFGLTGTLSSMLFEVSVTDPWIFILVTGFLTLVALIACYFPARRAMRIDPIIALRSE